VENNFAAINPAKSNLSPPKQLKQTRKSDINKVFDEALLLGYCMSDTRAELFYIEPDLTNSTATIFDLVNYTDKTVDLKNDPDYPKKYWLYA
jgi:hypothetical protein